MLMEFRNQACTIALYGCMGRKGIELGSTTGWIKPVLELTLRDSFSFPLIVDHCRTRRKPRRHFEDARRFAKLLNTDRRSMGRRDEINAGLIDSRSSRDTIINSCHLSLWCTLPVNSGAWTFIAYASEWRKNFEILSCDNFHPDISFSSFSRHLFSDFYHRLSSENCTGKGIRGNYRTGLFNSRTIFWITGFKD